MTPEVIYRIMDLIVAPIRPEGLDAYLATERARIAATPPEDFVRGVHVP